MIEIATEYTNILKPKTIQIFNFDELSLITHLNFRPSSVEIQRFILIKQEGL